MKTQEVLGIIPARGGSKSVPRKNIKNLCGKPLIAWTIEETMKSRFLTRTIVSTDDEEIAQVARDYGADVPFLRPHNIAQDHSIDLEFFKHALNWLKNNEGYEPEIVLRLPPTSPLRTADHIDDGINVLIKNPEADSARSIMLVDKHPYRMWKLSHGQKLIDPFLPEGITGMKDAPNQPRQSYPPVYVQTGALEVIRTRTIYDLNSTAGKKIAHTFMNPEDSINIDTEADFYIAESLLKRRLVKES
jgi:CMP-N,N'-diacetyllegionaminic acid synthase